ncbi:MAG: hypothetical protein ACFBSE_22020 [Prochloraceae cyanobacterium]
MSKAADKHPVGKHPNSLKNLSMAVNTGRKVKYESKKKNRTSTLTDESWEKLKLLANQHGCSGVSDFLEQIARGAIITLNSEEYLKAE